MLSLRSMSKRHSANYAFASEFKILAENFRGNSGLFAKHKNLLWLHSATSLGVTRRAKNSPARIPTTDYTLADACSDKELWSRFVV
jgi:hypothetical protein